MEDDLLVQCSETSRHLPIQGMDSVIATVSGYHGSQRCKLIKMISQVGASYVGAMNRSTTHLVCWKFEGKKYELARKLGTIIVNHQWVEDCMRQGRRVSPCPYTLQCGKEVGQLLLNRLPVADKVGPLRPGQSSMCNDTLEPVIDIDSEEDYGHDPWTGSSFLSQDVFPELERSNNVSLRLERKNVKRSSTKCLPSTSRSCFDDLPLSVMESDELSSPADTPAARKKKRTTTLAETSRKGYRKVKRTYRNILDYFSDSEKECGPVRVGQQGMAIQSTSNNSDDQMRSGSVVKGAHKDRINDHGGYRNVKSNIEEINNSSDVLSLEDSHLCTEQASSLNDIKCSTSSIEISCAICWTDFSAIRGILPCGHRFCFSCIQSWADHMASKRKVSTCPLCKANFVSITKVDDVVSSDQRIYSQTIPQDSTIVNVHIISSGEMPSVGMQSQTSVCCRCRSYEPEDLLVRCHLCQSQCVHTYCLDPPLFPWTCVHCKDLQMLYQHVR